jgi:hypothetical protein
VGTTSCIIRYHLKDKPVVSDWAAFYAHVQNTGDFDLMHRRVADAAVAERWENKQEVPGVGRFPVETITVSQK